MKVPGSESSTSFSLSGAKVPGSESSTYGTFAPGSESTRERKFQLPGAAIARPLRLCIGLAVGLGIGIVSSYDAIAMG